MKIAIPTADGRLCAHFGHCETFSLIEADPATRQILAETAVTPPPHEPGVLPRWLKEQGATTVIAGGMGRRAQDIFAAAGIAVVVGAPAEAPRALAEAWLNGTLAAGINVCDH